MTLYTYSLERFRDMFNVTITPVEVTKEGNGYITAVDSEGNLFDQPKEMYFNSPEDVIESIKRSFTNE